MNPLLVVVVLTRYFEGLQNTICRIDAASRIKEDVSLEEVIKGLNLALYNCADNLHKDYGTFINYAVWESVSHFKKAVSNVIDPQDPVSAFPPSTTVSPQKDAI